MATGAQTGIGKVGIVLLRPRLGGLEVFVLDLDELDHCDGLLGIGWGNCREWNLRRRRNCWRVKVLL